MSALNLIRARSLAGSGKHTRKDNLALVAAVDAVLAEVAEWDKSAEISENTANELHRPGETELASLHKYHAKLSYNHAARLRTAITHALNGATK